MSRTVPLLENVGRAMRRLHGVQGRLGTRLASRRGRMSVLALATLGALALALGAGVLPLVGGAADARGQLESGAAAATVSPGDTVPIWGPSQFNGSSGQGQTYVEQFTTTVNPARIYVLHLVNGAPDGTHRASKVIIKLNGFEVVSQTEVTQAVAQLDRVVAVTSVDTIRITVAGSGSPYITLSILSITAPEFNVYGPNPYNIPSGTSKTYNETFPKPATAAPPYRVYIVNGASDGTQRATSASVTLNGTQIVSTSQLTGAVGSLTKEVTLLSSNTLQIVVNGSVGRFITVRFTATDTTPPVLTITTPAPGTVTGGTSIGVSGTLQDQTPVSVTVNGTAATVINNTSYSATVPLPTEGSNLLTVTAIDGAGKQTDSTRSVIRDTQAPVLSVTAPPNGLITRDATVTVSGTVSDATAVTVNVNGTPLPVNGGAFTGAVSLAVGANTLTTTATDAGGNATTDVRTVTRDTTPPVLTVSSPAEGATTNSDSMLVSGTVSDATPVTVTANGINAPVNGGAFSRNVPLVFGPNTITIIATDAASNQTTVTRNVTRGPPPDPSTTAPPLNPKVATTLAAATAFLYTGPNAVQFGVASGTIDPTRAAVVRGKVLTANGQALSTATITILGHPEFGYTVSRADGMFDIVVNGGGFLTVEYARAGYLPAQRTVDVPWQDFTVLDDVVLTAPDPVVTAIDFSQPMQVARGSVVSDTDGTRRATVLFSQGTQATMVLADGSTQPLATLQVRATEYTVGARGLTAMPAQLPPTSGYTYAVEYSVDSALAVGAREVRFSQPVPTYVENFVGFPVGLAVPAGYYDRARGDWVPAPNGRVIKILSITNGRADLDVTGSGQVSPPDTVAAMGITDAERDQLGQLYAAGQTLWRVPVTHFTPWDYNWPFTAGPDVRSPPRSGPQRGRRPDDPDCKSGSIVECQTQVLRERIAVSGTPFSLNYSTRRVVGYGPDRTFRVQLSGDTVPSGPLSEVLKIALTVDVAGRQIIRHFPPTPNQVTDFTWDGKDAYGRTWPGAVEARVRVGYIYRPVATAWTGFGSAFFGLPSSASVGAARAVVGLDSIPLIGIVVSEQFVTLLGPWVSSASAGLGGWSLSAHHAYDPVERKVYLGDGTQRSAANLALVMQTVAGNGEVGCISCNLGEGVLATQGVVGSPFGVVAAPDGGFYVSDQMWGRVRRVGTDGIMTTAAGSGNTGGFSGDSGPATQAKLSQPRGLALAKDGTLYIADHANQRVRRVAPDGIITTVAGTGTAGFNGDNQPATSAQLAAPVAVAVGPDGSLYIVDQSNHRIRRVSPSGIIETVAGNGTQCFLGQLPQSQHGAQCGDSVPATQAKLGFPAGVAFGPDGSFYIADRYGRVRKVGLDGVITTVAGNGGASGTGDGGPALAAGLGSLKGIAVDRRGVIYVTHGEGSLDTVHAVRRIGADRIVTTVAGGGTFGFGAEGGPAIGGRLHDPVGVAVGPKNKLLIADLSNHRVRSVVPALPGLTTADALVASADGAELYQFDAAGRHRQTLSATTRDTLYAFAYDAAGGLLRVVDWNNDTTTVERDGNGAPTAIVAPYGQRTVLSLDAAGYIDSIANPAGEVFRPVTATSGLLSSLRGPRGHTSFFAYDSIGRLVSDSGPDGGVARLTTVRADSVGEVTYQTALGRTTTYRIEGMPTGGERRITTDPAGLVTTKVTDLAGRTTTALPTGDSVWTVSGPDPRWGMEAPLADSVTVKTPAGLRATVKERKRVTLSNPNDPLSLVSRIDSTTLNGQWTVSTYTAATRRAVTTSPLGRQAFATLDASGRVVAAQVAGLDSVRFSYDSRGRLFQEQVGGRTWTYEYDSRGRLLSTLDPLGLRDSLLYDDADRVIRRVLPGGRAVQFGYDSSGNLTSLTPPGRPAHGFAYTTIDLDSVYTPPSVGAGNWATQYRYTIDRELRAIVRPAGDSIALAYEAATGRLSTVTFDRGTLSYGYSPTTGTLSTITAPGSNTLSFTYDGSLPTSVTWAGAVAGSVGVAYNNDFRVTTQTVNGGNSVSFGYDNDGLLMSAGALGLKRHAQHGMVERDSMGSVLAVWGYDPKGDLASYTASFSGNPLFQTGYVRDSLGRITQLTETVQGGTTTRAFTYDSAGRLGTVTENGQLVRTYGYDGNGNRLSVMGPGLNITGSYDAQDRLSSYDGATYTYTTNGERQEKVVGTDTTRYTYDQLGNLTHVRLPDATVIEYVIDGQNRRVGKKVNGVLQRAWLWQSQLAPVAELDGAGVLVSRFVYATRVNVPDYMVKGSVTYRLILDHLGSVRLVVNTADGTLAQRIDYDEFGRVTQNTNPGFQPFAFAGGLYDEQTGLVRFGARDYDDATGRWASKDPASFAGGDANLFAYVRSDPVNLVDLNGLAWTDILKFLACPTGRSCGEEVVDVLIDAASGGVSRFFKGFRMVRRSREFAETASRRLRQSDYLWNRGRVELADDILRTSEGYRQGARDWMRAGTETEILGGLGAGYTLYGGVGGSEPLVVTLAKLIPGIGLGLEGWEAIKACTKLGNWLSGS